MRPFDLHGLHGDATQDDADRGIAIFAGPGLDKLLEEINRPDPYTPLARQQLVAAKRMLAAAYGDEAVEITLRLTCGSEWDTTEPCDIIFPMYGARRGESHCLGASAAEAAAALLRHYPPTQPAAMSIGRLDDAGDKLGTEQRPAPFETT